MAAFSRAAIECRGNVTGRPEFCDRGCALVAWLARVAGAGSPETTWEFCLRVPDVSIGIIGR